MKDQDHQGDQEQDPHGDHDQEFHGAEEDQHQDDEHHDHGEENKNIKKNAGNKPIVNARNYGENHSRMNPTLVPVDYEGHGYQMRILRNKLHELGGRQLSFGKYAKYELHWVVKNDPGYVNWCTRTPSPSNWMPHFLRT